MKRILVLCLALIFAVGSLAFPSYASEFDTGEWIELLDFNQITPEGNWIQIDSYAVLTMIPPVEAQFFNVDMVVFSSGTFTEVYETRAGNRKPLTVVPLGEGLYRIYGDLHTGSNYPAIYFEFLTSARTSMTVLSCRVSQMPVSYFNLSASGFLYAAGVWKDIIYSAGSQGVYDSINTSGTATWDFKSGVRLDDWRGYDFIDIHCSISGAASITSVSGYLVNSSGDVLANMVPLDISYISNSFYTDGDYEIIVRVNLRSLDRTQNYFPMIDICGEHGGQSIDFGIYGVTGYVFSDVVDQDIFWLKKFWNSVTSGFSSLITSIGSGFQSVVDYFNTTFWNALVSQYDSIRSSVVNGFNRVIELLVGKDAQDMQQDVQDQVDDFKDMQDAIDSVTTPDANDIDTDITGLVSTDQLISVQNVLGSLLEVEFLLNFISLSLILGLGSFLIYGRKD